ncbi:transmembrane protein 79 [Trichomycterus rosablanca]|uniref:transmembrane protein 79 n=1 Tax=Trichomycterus rosablanca TaxID=2290929 RepID=UPI002F354B56
MSELLFPDSAPILKAPPDQITKPSAPEWVKDEEEKMKTDLNRAEEEMTADVEPSTLPWPGDKADQPEPDNAESTRSDSVSLRGGASRTESEREFGGRDKRQTGDSWMEGERPEKVEHLEIEVEELNAMPEKAAGVFSPSLGIMRSVSMPNPPRHSSECWKEENTPFINHQGTLPDGYCDDYPRHYKTQCCWCIGGYRDVLKMGVSLFMSALIFPVLVWGGYVFLPFDAPVLDSAPLRLVYTLRCSVFAVIPIVLGVLVLGVSRIHYRALQPLCDEKIDQVNIHRSYVDDSISLFLLYFLQLGVMAAYLDQNLLKLVPLLTIIFVFGRLVYWIAAACGSSLRGFGFGFCFFPMLTMLVANLYFIFMTDSAGSIFAQENLEPPGPPQDHRQRFWG